MARRHRGGGKVIDFKSWVCFAGSQLDISTATTTILGTPLDFTSPVTILRCRGRVQAAFDESVQVGDRIALTMGLGIVSTDAATVGATAVPEPFTDCEYSWLWWGSIHLESFLANGNVGNNFGSGMDRLEIDTKAMRRVKPAESLVFVVQSDSLTGAPVTSVDFHPMRVLIGQ